MNKQFLQITVLVAGAGTMDSGIAQFFAAHGITTYLSDLNETFTQKGLEKITVTYDQMIADHLCDASYKQRVLKKIHPITNDAIPDLGKKIDIIFEAILEKSYAVHS